jgi:hypothetical protein
MMLVEGNNFISHYLKLGKPLCAGKIGVTELNLMYCAHTIENANRFQPQLQHEVEDIAGLYPYTVATTLTFNDYFKHALKQVDLIPQWNKVNPMFEKFVFEEYCPEARLTRLQDLEPYFFEKPWTNYLEGKKVLVFSPFAESIENNYKNLDKIWNNRIISNFRLKTVKYPFALKIAPNPKYKSSFDIYEEYLEILRNEEFDVGIFGTGFTSLLFAAECKRLGKTGIHLGGSTQILFGVKGQRWLDIPEFAPFFNDYWTTPLDSEKPEKRQIVEGGCYWA